MNKKEPKFLLKLLRQFCKPDYLEEIEGDLLERYNRKPSQLRFTLEVLKLLRPKIMRSIEGTYKLNYFGVVKNQLRTSSRFLKKEKGFTLMNVAGLSLGMACCLFISLWLTDELKYNTHLTSSDRVCKVLNVEIQADSKINTNQQSSYELKSILDEKYPVVESAALLSNGNWMAFQVGEDVIEWDGVDATPEVFEMFEIDFIQGSPAKLNENSNTLVISEKVAEVYFGENWEDEQVVGSYMENDDGETLELAGVYRSLPKHSTISFDFVVPFSNLLKKRPYLKSWKNNANHLYIKLKDGLSLTEANRSLKEAINDHRVDDFQLSRTVLLQPFEDLYLYNRYEHGKPAGGRIDYVILLSITAILVLLLATINFMNLTTARASKRAKETGVRKVLGASKRSVRIQFQMESILMVSISAGVTCIYLFLLFPWFEELTGKEFDLSFLTWEYFALIFAFILIQGILTGAYPALFLSSIKSIQLLKSGSVLPEKQIGFRKGLLIFQFSITLLMIIGSLTVYQQVSYIQTKNIGLDRSNLIRAFSYDMDPVTDYQRYKTELLSKPGVADVSIVNQLPIDVRKVTSKVSWEGNQNLDEIDFYWMQANPDLLPTMKIELKNGRNFDWELQTDNNNFIINETAARMMKLTDPINKTINFSGQKGKIIGVVEDFHNASLHRAIKPLIILNHMEDSWMVLVRSKPGMNKQAILSLEEVFLKFNPNREFWYRFVDDMYNAKYKNELLVQKLSLYFTIISIAISLLGLIALVTYSTERKIKEIGIRKILGATIPDILRLLSAEYVRLLLISIAIGFPIAYIIMSDWLSDFVYRIELNWMFFAVSGITMLVIALGIIGIQTRKVATSNPVESLKDE